MNMIKEQKDKPIKGNCAICGKDYDKNIWEYGAEHYDPDRYIFVKCPNCFFHPDIWEKLELIVEQSFRIEMFASGIKLNTKYIRERVFEEIFKKYWPKPEGKR